MNYGDRFADEALHAVFPWDSPYRDERELWNESYYNEPEEKKNQCFNCPLAECVNCLAGYRYNRPGRPSNIDLDALRQLLTLKKTCKQVMEETGISRRLYYYYKKKLNA